MTTQPGPTTDLPHGAVMPLLGFGTWQLRGTTAYDGVRAALELGYRHVDTATMYRNEHEVGRAIRESGILRTDVFVTTKLAPGDAHRADEIIAASLEAMQLDHVDLWLIHWPPGRAASPQTWQRLIAARERGLAREVGVSNYSVAQIDELDRATGERPAVNQVEWGPMLFDAALQAEHRSRGVVLEGYSPFMSTDLRNRTLASIAESVGRTVPQVVLRWHLQHEVVAIPRSSSPARIAENFDVFDFTLSATQMSAIDGLGG